MSQAAAGSSANGLANGTASGSGSEGGAGWIRCMDLRNFMCHEALHVDFIRHVNFITGSNGSGKSAVLTGLCVAFGTRARTTNRASAIKDFIRTGCSAAVVSVELNNEGEEAFRPDEFGPRLTVERRITDNGSSTLALKDFRGRKVRSKREDLDELTAHFNLDVDNPCIVMSQDKSREFLHSGTPKDKYKFFIKATLLEKVSARLGTISGRLVVCRRQLGEAETALVPLEEKARQAEQLVRELEEAESRGQEADRVTKQLAWAYVHEAEQEVVDAERAKHEAQERVAELEERLATAQSRVETVQQQMEQHMGRVKGVQQRGGARQGGAGPLQTAARP
ncbi:unnamed protein product, partial [Closterium sp. Yama58-4]